MTWKEFKEALESQGVKDDDEIDYIETTVDDSADLVVMFTDRPGGGRRVEIL